MRNANLVADELHTAGFRTKVFTSNAVAVSLTSRKVSTMEVGIALDKIFDGITFQIDSTTSGAMVTW